MSEKMQYELEKNVDELTTGKRSHKTADLVNKAAHHSAMTTNADAKAKDRGMKTENWLKGKEAIKDL